MIKASIPANDNQRLADLYQYDILDSLPELEFDELVNLASRICKVPISLVSLIDADRQWFKAKIGVEASETARDISFCGHAIQQDGLFIVPDATKDDRFSDNPMVTGEQGIRFYAGVPLTSEMGYNVGMLCVKDNVPRDLTQEQREALVVLGKQVMKQMELRLKNKELERISAAQQRIISIMAHDIRNPMAAIASLLELYDQKIVAPERLPAFINEISNSLKGTMGLLENLIDWGKMQIQKNAVAPVPVSLKEIVEKIFVELAAASSKKGNKLDFEFADGSGVTGDLTVTLDENIFKFILRNLVTNANKFTQNGNITVVAQQNKNQLIIHIKDTGIGMPAHVCAKLFDGPGKCSRKGTQNESGSGLGLVLVREFVEKCGGTISASSEEGKGTCISFSLEVGIV
jgi:signal transduction histidine kinase